MLAEAENEANQGPTTSAYEAINEVRERAGIDLVGLPVLISSVQLPTLKEHRKSTSFFLSPPKNWV